MSVFETSRVPSHAAHTGFFSKLFASAQAWNEARLTRVALSKLSDRELADIGLSRYDAENIGR